MSASGNSFYKEKFRGGGSPQPSAFGKRSSLDYYVPSPVKRPGFSDFGLKIKK